MDNKERCYYNVTGPTMTLNGHEIRPDFVEFKLIHAFCIPSFGCEDISQSMFIHNFRDKETGTYVEARTIFG